jgi:hypothetical protein
MNILTKLLVILVALLLTGCSLSIAGNGEYQTGKLAEVQKAVPFTISMPKYLPENIRSARPSFQNSISDLERSVVISYENKQSYCWIFIEEGSQVYFTAPSTYSVFLTINEIQIRESPDIDRMLTDKPITGFRYDWNKNNIHFMLLIYGYEQTECRKVMESIIQQ